MALSPEELRWRFGATLHRDRCLDSDGSKDTVVAAGLNPSPVVTPVNKTRVLRAAVWLLGCGAWLLAGQRAAVAAEGAEGITAVSSEVNKDYRRVKLPDGSYRAEDYAFGNGGYLGGPFTDETIDKLSFLDIARVIAVPLAEQKYLPGKDQNTTKLLIMVYWGTTVTPGRPQGEADNRFRDHEDYLNAQLLGYDSEGLIGTEYGANIELTALRWHRRDLVQEIEYNRYFVVLMAYDFQKLKNQKMLKPLWETRFSLNQRSNEFDKALPAMARTASRYFGQDSHGLVRRPIREGHVEVGEPTLIEELISPPRN
jgi:hypothetical protein